MAKVKNAYPKTFRPLLIERIGAFLVFGTFLAAFVAMLADSLSRLQFSFSSEALITLIIAVLTLYFVASIIWFLAEFTFHFAITLTQDGIWFHGYGKRFYTWDSMTDLAENRNGWSSQSTWGINAQQPQIVYRNVVAKWFFGNWLYNNFIPLYGIVTVPKRWLLLRDMEAFKKTEFGQELCYFAPHLFDDDSKEKRKNHLQDVDNYEYDIVSNEDYQDISQ